VNYRFFLFGGLQILLKEEPVDLPPYRAYDLLAFLLLLPSVQRREQIAGMLYPDESEKSGRRRLSDVLYLLRKSLSGLEIEQSRNSIHLPVEKRWLDVEIFEEAVVQSDLESWLGALRLYRGELLGGYGGDWSLEIRENLHLKYVHTAHKSLELLLHRRDIEAALPIAERLVQQEPYDEKALRILMQAYQAVKRRGAALALYEGFVDRAALDLQTEPERATQELAEIIRQALPVSTQADEHGIAESADATWLYQQAHIALASGKLAVVRGIIDSLRHREDKKQEALYLDIDLALFLEEYERADTLLSTCDKEQAGALVRIAELAHKQREWEAAEQTASQALLMAHGARDSTCEIRALAILAQAQFQLGRRNQCLRSLEQSLRLARLGNSRADMTSVLLTAGELMILFRNFELATIHLQEAQSLCEAHDFRFYGAMVHKDRAWLRFYDGELLDAIQGYQQALSIVRDFGLVRQEVSLMILLAEVYDNLGQSRQSARLLEDAQTLLEQSGDAVESAIIQYNRVFNLLYNRDELAPQAIELAEKALEVFRMHDQQTLEASTLNVLGYALWVDGRYNQALDVLEEAFRLHERLKKHEILTEVRMVQALAHLGSGDLEHAERCASEALLGLVRGEIVSSAIAVEVYYAYAAIQAAQGNRAQADDYLRRAYDNLLEMAAQMSDETARQALFKSSPITRRLMQEVYRREIASEPPIGAVRCRLTDAGRRTIEVSLMIDAGPADQALKLAQGAIALRRARLKRLTQQADSQGVHLTNEQLADMLGVSIRTIQRDRSELRSD
jgi:DNA-binding SARP family transcriptional activator